MPHIVIAAPTALPNQRRQAGTSSWVPPHAAIIWERSRPRCCDCSIDMAPPNWMPPSAEHSKKACHIPMQCASSLIIAASNARSCLLSPSSYPPTSRPAMLTSRHTRLKLMINSRSQSMNNLDALRGRAEALHLNGLLAHWAHVAKESWVETLIDWEEQERARRSLERRLRAVPVLAVSNPSATST